jgi:hypothetical protein
MLELITDDENDGWALARRTVQSVKKDSLQRKLAALLSGIFSGVPIGSGVTDGCCQTGVFQC